MQIEAEHGKEDGSMFLIDFHLVLHERFMSGTSSGDIYLQSRRGVSRTGRLLVRFWRHHQWRCAGWVTIFIPHLSHHNLVLTNIDGSFYAFVTAWPTCA